MMNRKMELSDRLAGKFWRDSRPRTRVNNRTGQPQIFDASWRWFEKLRSPDARDETKMGGRGEVLADKPQAKFLRGPQIGDKFPSIPTTDGSAVTGNGAFIVEIVQSMRRQGGGDDRLSQFRRSA